MLLDLDHRLRFSWGFELIKLLPFVLWISALAIVLGLTLLKLHDLAGLSVALISYCHPHRFLIDLLDDWFLIIISTAIGKYTTAISH
jgi:hypothetical protein